MFYKNSTSTDTVVISWLSNPLSANLDYVVF